MHKESLSLSLYFSFTFSSLILSFFLKQQSQSIQSFPLKASSQAHARDNPLAAIFHPFRGISKPTKRTRPNSNSNYTFSLHVREIHESFCRSSTTHRPLGRLQRDKQKLNFTIWTVTDSLTDEIISSVKDCLGALIIDLINFSESTPPCSIAKEQPKGGRNARKLGWTGRNIDVI